MDRDRELCTKAIHDRSKPCNQGWIDFLRSTGARHGRGTAAEGETGLDFAGEKSAC